MCHPLGAHTLKHLVVVRPIQILEWSLSLMWTLQGGIPFSQEVVDEIRACAPVHTRVIERRYNQVKEWLRFECRMGEIVGYSHWGCTC